MAGADLIPHRVALARQFGLQREVDPRDAVEAVRSLRAWSDGFGADAVIVCAGSASSAPTRLALELARDRGRVIVVGSSGLSLERAPLYRKELVFRVSRSYGPGRYDPSYEEEGRDYPVGFVRWTENRNFGAFLSLLESGAIDVTPLLSSHFPVERAADAYASLKAGDDAPLTAVLDYDVTDPRLDREPVHRVVLRESASPRKAELRIGLIGCGAFARSQILPALRSLPGLRIHAVAAATGVSAANVGRLVKAAYSTTDFEEILGDSEIDALVIATRHGLHHPIALAAARSGKPFHVEKPLAIHCEEAREIVAAVAESGVPSCVGFNRRSAPFVQSLKTWLAKRSGPVDILIRVNASPLPADHWTLDPREGGGRLVGEGCHFLDLAAFLAGSSGRVVAAASTGLRASPDAEGDLTIVMNLSDGSRATICYGSMGHRALPKERVEVSWDGHSVVIDDFKRLECHGVGRSRRVRVQDKGIPSHFANFVAALRGQADLVAPVTAGLDVAERIEEARALLAGQDRT
jgi:predicted dehydrogenase